MARQKRRKLTITIDLEGDAFRDGEPFDFAELNDVLRQASDKLLWKKKGDVDFSLVDRNGNECGRVKGTI